MREDDEIDIIDKAMREFYQYCKDNDLIYRAAKPVMSSKENDIIILRDMKSEVAQYRIQNKKDLKLISHECEKNK